MKYILLFALFVTTQFSFSQAITPKMSADQIKIVQKKIASRLGKNPLMFTPWSSQSERKVTLTKVTISPSQNRIRLYFNQPLSQIAQREEQILQWEQMVRDTLGSKYKDCKVQLYSKTVPIEKYIPNYFRLKIAKDNARQGRPTTVTPLTTNRDRPIFSKGLTGRHIALWASHGLYYEKDEKKEGWIWQRPALFGSIEDVNTFQYMYQYVMPMLENAGAVLLSPRERDPNTNEIIVDEDQARTISGTWRSAQGGFAKIARITTENPFTLGSHLVGNGTVEYLINAPDGEYGICVSYQASPTASSAVEYKVNHSGGQTTYVVNQQIGSGWVYLGTHNFDKSSKVTVHSDVVATTDAIRLGGGMGNVDRGGTVSGVARWAEAARYYMQYNGVPASVYASYSQEKSLPKDYVDDYKSRGDWATWIQNEKGVPLDAVVALHTNAGVNDTIFGSLTINSTEGNDGKYTNGTSKFAGRDFADIVLTQIVDDVRAKYTKQWTRRSMYDKQYSEAFRTDAPTVLIELLSHQNMNDMRLALDPAFRFDVSRAIYKGVVRFISERYSLPYVIQPLAPTNFGMEIIKGQLCLSWKEQNDPLEKTAKALSYRLYTRTNSGGFDNGVPINGNSTMIPLAKDGVVRSYKVTAINDGGESFSSEVLSACFLPGSSKIAIVVNEFTRLSPPDTVSGGLDFHGFMPFKHDYSFVGEQRDFDRSSPFIDNDNPGWGASTLSKVTVGILGNTFDYTVIHGATLLSQGYSYISTSLAAFNKNALYDKVVKITEPADRQKAK